MKQIDHCCFAGCDTLPCGCCRNMLGHYNDCEVRKAQLEKAEKVNKAIEEQNWVELDKLLGEE